MSVKKWGRKRFHKKGNKTSHVSKVTKKYVKKVLDTRIEDKYSDNAATIAAGSASTNTTGAIVPISNLIAQGTGAANARTGNQVRVKELEIFLNAQSFPVTTVNTNDTNLRCIIFQDKQIFNTTPATVGEVLETVVYNSSLDFNMLRSKRFHILMDKLIQLDPISSIAALTPNYTNKSFQVIRKKFKLNSIMSYSGNGVADYQKNHIFMLLLSDKATATSPGLDYWFRIVYEDA